MTETKDLMKKSADLTDYQPLAGVPEPTYYATDVTSIAAPFRF